MRPMAVTLLGLALASCGTSKADTPDHTPVVRVEEVEPLAVDVTFSDVREITVTDEAIWVLDRHPPFVTFIQRAASSGIARFGDRGDGPHELRQPVALDPVENGVHVWDVELGKRVLYAVDGSLDEVERLSPDRSGPIRSNIDRVSHLDPWRVRRLGQRWVYNRFPDGMNRPMEYGRGSLVVVDQNLGSPAPLIGLTELVPRDARSIGQFPAMPLWDACPAGLLLWNPRLARIEWRNATGSLTRTQPVSSEGVETTLPGVERFLREMARLELGPGTHDVDIRGRAEAVQREFGELATPFVDLRCGGNGSAWLRLFDLEADAMGDGPSWLSLSPSGHPAQVRFPDGFTPHVFADDAVLGVVETEQGQALALWKATVPPY